MKRFILALALALPALAQNTFRAVPTAASLVSADPRTFAANPLNGGSTFESIVFTTGDSVAGSGWKTWRWDAASSAATNTALANGPLAWPYGAATGRWVLVPSAKDTVQDLTITALGYVTPEAYGAAGDGVTDDTAAVQAAMTAGAAADNQTCMFRKTYRINQTGVINPDNVTMLFVGDSRLEPTAHPSSLFEADEAMGRLVELGDNNRVIGSGQFHFNGRRSDATYTATIPGGTWRKYAAFRARGATNCVIEGVGFTDYYDCAIYTRDAGKIEVRRCTFTKGSQAVRIYNSPQVLFEQNLIHSLEQTAANVAPTVTVFQDCAQVRITGNVLENILATSGSTSSGLNIFSCPGALLDGNWFGPLRSGSTLSFTTITLDGSEGCIVERNTFFAINTGGAVINTEGARFFTVRANTSIPPPPAYYTGVEPGYWVYTRSAEIHGVTKPGGTKWSDTGIQERSHSAAYNGVISGNFFQRGDIGVYANGSGLLIENNWLIGQQIEGIRQESHVNGATTGDDFSVNNITHRHREITIRGNVIKNAFQTGLRVTDGKELLVEGNTFANNDQDDNGNHAFTISPQASGTIGTGSTSTVIVVGGSLTANTLGGRHLWLPDTRQIAEIESNTTTTITLRGSGVTSAPTNGQGYAILRGHLDVMIFRDNRIYDNQLSQARTNIVSLNPTQTYSSSSLFAVSTTDGELFETGRRLVLKGVLTGPADATVEVISADMDYADTYWLKPISPTSGTFITAAGTAIRNGTGTLSHTASLPANQFENNTLISGSGTAFTTWGQTFNNAWINVNSQWLRIQRITSATSLNVLTKPSANFAGQSFTISLVNVEGIQTQGRAYSVQWSPVRMAMSGNVMYGNEGSSGVTSPQGLVDFATCPNFIPRILGNSTTPTVDLTFPVMRFDYSSATTITDLRNAFHGAEILLYPDPDSDVTLGFASGGTKLRGNGGANEALDPGELAVARYIHDASQDGYWYITIIK